MRSRRLAGITMLGLVATTLPITAMVSTAAAKPAAYTKKTLTFDMVTGPNDNKHCKVVADLYKSAGVSKNKPAPAIITTNGFGGSKDDGAGVAADFAPRGSSSPTPASASAAAAAGSPWMHRNGTARSPSSSSASWAGARRPSTAPRSTTSSATAWTKYWQAYRANG